MMKALVIRHQALGDVLLAEPFARIVAKSHSVYFATQSRYIPIFDNHPSIRAIDIKRMPATDVVFDLRDTYETRIDDGIHMIDAYLDAYGLSANDDEKIPQIFLTEAEKVDVHRWLGTDSRWAVLDIGYPGGPIARGHWEMSHWRPVCTHVQALGYKIVLIGTYEHVYIDSSMVDIDLHRQTTLRQLFAIMSMASLYVGMDSGAMHLAQSLGVPGVAIFNPRHPASTLLLPKSPIAPLHAGKGDAFPIDEMIASLK